MPSYNRPTLGILGGKPAIWPERKVILRFQAEGCDFGDGKKVIGKMVIDPGGWVTVKILRRRKRWTLPLRDAIAAIAIAAQRRECERIFGGSARDHVEPDSGDGASPEGSGAREGDGV